MPKITPNLWFDTQAEEAANFYVSIFENSEILHVAHYGEAGPGPEGTVVTVEFRLDGQEVLAINGGPEFTFSEAVSFAIDCATQDEVDYYWEKLTEGGSPGPCGWLKDKYGFSWQVVPTMLSDLMRTGDPEKVNRMTKAMYQMSKLDIAQLQAAYDQE